MKVFFWGEWWHFIPRNNGAANHPINGFYSHSLARNFRYNFYVSFNILRVAWKVYELSHRWCVTISHFVDLIVTHSVRSIGGAAYSTSQDIISWYERASKLILGTVNARKPDKLPPLRTAIHHQYGHSVPKINTRYSHRLPTIDNRNRIPDTELNSDKNNI